MEDPPDPPESLAIGSSDLRFLLSSHNVDEPSQAKLFENGIDTLAKFAAFVTSEDELTKVLKASFGLDPESSLKVRGQVASYLVAWTRIKMQAEAEATSELREQTDYVAMRHAYAKSYGELEDKQIPSKEYLEKKLHELENGEFRAEALTETRWTPIRCYQSGTLRATSPSSGVALRWLCLLVQSSYACG